MPRTYELLIAAAGEVRDANGNLKSAEPVTTTITVTEEQLQAILAANPPTRSEQ